MGGRSSSFGTASGSANTQTLGFHNSQVSKLAGSSYPDGTYDLDTLTPIEYESGYQVTFSQIGDNYSAREYADRVNEFLGASSDGKTAAGKFESTPEVSFHVNSKREAVRLAKKYNQISIWDWKNCDVIETGGTGRRN